MVPLWLWLLMVIAVVLVGIRVGRDRPPACVWCHRRLSVTEWRLTPHDHPGAPPLCLDCYGRTFR